MILEAIFQAVPHFTFLPPEGQALPIALHRHQKSPRYELINQDRTRLTQREKISPLRREQASRLAGHRQSRRLPSASLCGKPAPLVENETLRRVSACKAVCAALREGEGSGATLRIKPPLSLVWRRIHPGDLTNEPEIYPFDLWAR